MAKLTDITGIGPALAGRLTDAGITTVDAVAKATPSALAEVQGLSVASARLVIADARKVARSSAAPAKAAPKAPEAKAAEKATAPAAKKDGKAKKGSKGSSKSKAKAKSKLKKASAKKADRKKKAKKQLEARIDSLGNQIAALGKAQKKLTKQLKEAKAARKKL